MYIQYQQLVPKLEQSWKKLKVKLVKSGQVLSQTVRATGG